MVTAGTLNVDIIFCSTFWLLEEFLVSQCKGEMLEADAWEDLARRLGKVTE